MKCGRCGVSINLKTFECPFCGWKGERTLADIYKNPSGHSHKVSYTTPTREGAEKAKELYEEIIKVKIDQKTLDIINNTEESE